MPWKLWARSLSSCFAFLHSIPLCVCACKIVIYVPYMHAHTHTYTPTSMQGETSFHSLLQPKWPHSTWRNSNICLVEQNWIFALADSASLFLSDQMFSPQRTPRWLLTKVALSQPTLSKLITLFYCLIIYQYLKWCMYVYMHVSMHVYCLFPHLMTQITGGQKNVFLPCSSWCL